MIDEAEAQLFGDALLQQLELVIDEFDDVAGFDVDQMVVMGIGRGFIARPAVAELRLFGECPPSNRRTVR